LGASTNYKRKTTKGRRKLNVALALKIEEKLSLEEGSLALLQPIFDIQEQKVKQNKKLQT
jgi:hypothetical protein